jgi:hypothetical protein
MSIAGVKMPWKLVLVRELSRDHAVAPVSDVGQCSKVQGSWM